MSRELSNSSTEVPEVGSKRLCTKITCCQLSYCSLCNPENLRATNGGQWFGPRDNQRKAIVESTDGVSCAV